MEERTYALSELIQKKNYLIWMDMPSIYQLFPSQQDFQKSRQIHLQCILVGSVPETKIMLSRHYNFCQTNGTSTNRQESTLTAYAAHHTLLHRLWLKQYSNPQGLPTFIQRGPIQTICSGFTSTLMCRGNHCSNMLVAWYYGVIAPSAWDKLFKEK